MTLEAVGGTGSPFVRWNRFDCEGTGPCAIAVEESRVFVVATFRDQTLEVLINGAPSVDAVKSSTGDLSCAEVNGNLHCTASVEAETDVVLTAQEQHTWGKGCEPSGGDPASPTCELAMTSLRTFATVGFGVEPPRSAVRRACEAQGPDAAAPAYGRITGQGKDGDGNDWRIDCGWSCSAENLQYQSRVTLLAEPEPGSTFVRWLGVCSTASVCRVSAGVANLWRQSSALRLLHPFRLTSASAPADARPRFGRAVCGEGDEGHTPRQGPDVVPFGAGQDRSSGEGNLSPPAQADTLGTRKFALESRATLLRFPLPPRLKLGWYRVTARFVSQGWRDRFAQLADSAQALADGSETRTSTRPRTYARIPVESAPSSEGRVMRIAKQAGVVVGLLSGIVGLLFLFLPQLKPEAPPLPAAEQLGTLSGLILDPDATRGQYLERTDQSKQGFTTEQLARRGAFIRFRVEILGYKSKTLPLQRELVDAHTGDEIAQPCAPSRSHRP